MADIKFSWVVPDFMDTVIECLLGTAVADPEAGEGPLVVMLADTPVWMDDKKPRVLGEEAAATAADVIGTALEAFKGNGRVLIIPATEVAGTPAQAVIEIAKKLKPDVILAAGEATHLAITRASKYPDDPRYTYGWYRKLTVTSTNEKGKTRSAKVKTAACLPISIWTDPDPPVRGIDGGGAINLLNTVISALVNGLRGGANPFSAVKYVNTFSVDKKSRLPHYTHITTLKQFRRMMKELKSCRTPAFDTEGTGLWRKASSVLTLQIALPDLPDGSNKLYVLPLAHAEASWTAKELATMSMALREYFEFSSSNYTIFHNAKFDINMLMNAFGVRWYNHRVYDTMNAEHLLDENRKYLHKNAASSIDGKKARPFALDTLELAYGYMRPSLAIGKADRSNMADKPLQDIADYGAVDPLATWAIHKAQIDRAKAEKYTGFLRVVLEQTGANQKIIARMERNGIPVDANYLRTQALPGSELNTYIQGYLAKFMASEAVQKANAAIIKQSGYRPDGLFGKVKAPWHFNVNKPAHAATLFFDVLGLSPISYTKKGKPQVNKKFQKSYSKTVPEVAVLAAYKELSTLKSNFIDAIIDQLTNSEDAKLDNCVRSSYSQTSVATARLSSWDINLQNLPNHGKMAKLVKRAFICRRYYVRLKADFQAHEVRMLGNISGDDGIIGAFQGALRARLALRLAKGVLEKVEVKDASGKVIKETWTSKSAKLKAALDEFAVNGDIHVQNVLRVYGIQIDTKHPLRQEVKAAIFSLIYGAGPLSLGKGILEKRAEKLKDELYVLEAKLEALRCELRGSKKNGKVNRGKEKAKAA